jgi:hypothetical protein
LYRRRFRFFLGASLEGFEENEEEDTDDVDDEEADEEEGDEEEEGDDDDESAVAEVSLLSSEGKEGEARKANAYCMTETGTQLSRRSPSRGSFKSKPFTLER